jgi:hypothetical protein
VKLVKQLKRANKRLPNGVTGRYGETPGMSFTEVEADEAGPVGIKPPDGSLT